MSSISTRTFAPLGHPNIRTNFGIVYFDYSFRDFSTNWKDRKWDACYNSKTGVWTVVKSWMHIPSGQPQYIKAPRKIRDAILHLLLVTKVDFPGQPLDR